MRAFTRRTAWPRRTPRTAVFTLAVVTGAVALVLAGGASASHNAISISTGKSAGIVSGVYLTVPISISCADPATLAPFTFVYDEEVNVSVTQKTSGRTIVRGSGGFSFVDNTLYGWGSPYGTPLVCDGTAHSYTVNVFPASAPFHGGQAVVQANVSIDLRDPGNPWGQNDYTYADSGPQTISLRG